jgi:hypothetical protein
MASAERLFSVLKFEFVDIRELFAEDYAEAFTQEFTEEFTEHYGAPADRRRRSGTLVYNEKFHQNAILHLSNPVRPLLLLEDE